jgi:hypothetical protein
MARSVLITTDVTSNVLDPEILEKELVSWEKTGAEIIKAINDAKTLKTST